MQRRDLVRGEPGGIDELREHLRGRPVRRTLQDHDLRHRWRADQGYLVAGPQPEQEDFARVAVIDAVEDPLKPGLVSAAGASRVAA